MKNMKMKLLDYTLIGLLAGMAPLAMAQQGKQPGDEAPAATLACGDAGCNSDEGLLFKLRTRSYDKPLTEGTNAVSYTHLDVYKRQAEGTVPGHRTGRSHPARLGKPVRRLHPGRSAGRVPSP